MYLTFYGLSEAPFGPTPDPKFLFQSVRHREALAQLIYGIQERKGFIVLTGEIGTGKTTLLRTLLERIDPETPVAYVHNSSLDIEGLSNTSSDGREIRHDSGRSASRAERFLIARTAWDEPARH